MITSQKKSSAFTLKELLLAFVILAILLAIPAMKFASQIFKKKKIYCTYNLKNIGLGIRLFAEEHNGLFPWQTSENQSILSSNRIDLLFLSLSNELSTPKILACDSDIRPVASNWSNFTRANVSYFIGLTSAPTNPASILSGDRNLLINSNLPNAARFHIKPSSTLTWDNRQHQRQGNIVLADGSIEQCSNARLNAYFAKAAGTNISTFLFP